MKLTNLEVPNGISSQTLLRKVSRLTCMVADLARSRCNQRLCWGVKPWQVGKLPTQCCLSPPVLSQLLSSTSLGHTAVCGGWSSHRLDIPSPQHSIWHSCAHKHGKIRKERRKTAE